MDAMMVSTTQWAKGTDTVLYDSMVYCTSVTICTNCLSVPIFHERNRKGALQWRQWDMLRMEIYPHSLLTGVMLQIMQLFHISRDLGSILAFTEPGGNPHGHKKNTCGDYMFLLRPCGFLLGVLFSTSKDMLNLKLISYCAPPEDLRDGWVLRSMF